MRRGLHTVLSSIVLILAVLFAAGQLSFPAFAAEDDRIYYFNMSGAAEGNFILVQSEGHWGLIDAGHRYADTIMDSDGVWYSVSQADGLSSQISCRNGKDAAQFMVNKLGVTHLDFIIGTHAHSDHIGGIPEIATSTFTDISGNKVHLVDSNTTYYYKEYLHINDLEDDLVHAGDSSWHNQAFVYQATKAMQDLGANVVDVSKQSVIHGDPGNSYGDYLSFRMGDMSFRLYNLYGQNSGHENSNSIVTVLKNDKYEVVNLADIDINNAAIDETSMAIGKDFGNVDVVIAGHHGYSGSNTKTMFDALKPEFVVVTAGSNASVFSVFDFAAAQPYAADQYGTAFYSTALSQNAVVTDLSGNSVWVYDLQSDGSLKDAFFSAVRSTGKTGWVSWANVGETLWSYLENGIPVRNCWKWIDDRCYYFYDNGIMAANAFVDDYYVDASGAWVPGYTVPDQTGWIDYNGNRAFRFDDGNWASGWLLMDGSWYYFGQNKFAVKGHQYIDGTSYYFDENGVLIVNAWVNGYYLDSNGNPARGWQLIDGRWYYFSDDSIPVTGWQKIDGIFYFLRDDGTLVQDDWVGTTYVNSSGEALSGWQSIRDHWYFFNQEYSYVTGWQQVDGRFYFFRDDGTLVQDDWVGTTYVNSSGEALSGWQNIHDRWYYFDQEYSYVTGWQKIDGEFYFFRDDGSMIQDEWLGGAYVDSSGAALLGWQYIRDHWYYFDQEYACVTGWQEIEGKFYFFRDDGSMVQDEWLGGAYVDPSGEALLGWQTIHDNRYYFDQEYACVTGWQEIDGEYYFFRDDGSLVQDGWLGDTYVDSVGTPVTGWQLVEGKWFYFESDYTFINDGWREIDGDKYYFYDDGSLAVGTWLGSVYVDENGRAVTGWQFIQDNWYYFGSDYSTLTGWQEIDGKTYFFYEDGSLAMDTTIDGYYVDSDGVWIP